MSARKWFYSFIIMIIFIISSIALFNIALDPFGVFGDPFLNWNSYNFTKNPRAAKVVYLNNNNEKYDSYIIGSSGTSSYPVEVLNEYYDASFYNLFGYGADMYKSKELAKYVIENFEVKNLVLSVGLYDATKYNAGSDSLNDDIFYKVDNTSPLSYYPKYLFANPQYGMEKIKALFENNYLQQAFDVFDEETGSYDKRKRDVEFIGKREEYIENNQEFNGDKYWYLDLSEIDKCIEAVAEVKKMCEDNNINFDVIFMPMPYEQFLTLDKNQIMEFQKKLANVTDFYDFSISSISLDQRYFYDATHFRNTVGAMAIKKMFGESKDYIPDDFGQFVNKDNINEHLKIFEQSPIGVVNDVEVPILIYHHIAEDGVNISKEIFEDHIKTLKANGYNSVTFSQLCDYVNKGYDLPEKPIVITFDDGYSSNYDIGYEILKKYDMKASIFLIGCSVGKDFYKDTKTSIIPHFTYEQAKEMAESGVIEIGSHSYDMHQVEGLDNNPVRQGVLELEGEKEEDYINLFQKDLDMSRDLIENEVGVKVSAYAYPYGLYTVLTEILLMENGVKSTLITDEGANTIIKGMPQSLFKLKRLNADIKKSGQELVDFIKIQ